MGGAGDMARRRGADLPGIGRIAAVAAAVVLACFPAACGTRSRAPESGGRRGGAGLEAKVEFADLDRIHATLGGLRGRPVFVTFWATWCVPCVEELPDLAALSREDGVAGAGFLGISLDAWVTGNGTETEDKVKRSLADAGVGYLNLIYRGDQDPLIEGLQLPGPIPYSVLYDAQGKQVASWTGKAAIQEVREGIAAAAPTGAVPAATGSPEAPGGR
jgi:thiol-disulfide isomerase/thioredoxin